MKEKKYKFKLLIPLWGESYIDLFCQHGLPTLFSEGNLLTLKKQGQLDICFLTLKGDRDYFNKHFLFQTLYNTYNVIFSYIDSFFNPSSYGVTLTYAYAQGIREEAAAVQLKTHFIFLNGDFLLSDNAFLNLLKLLNSGNSAVVCPSLRCKLEAVKEKLASLRNKHSLDTGARSLVRLGLDNLHPTVFSKMINQETFYSEVVNQFYWQVDSDTLLGQFFLMSMLCLKPEKPFIKVHGYCDYSFVSDLCPSGAYAIVQDSDEIFILEASPENQERNTIRLGAPSVERYADILSSWTTKLHREYASPILFFHAKELPEAVFSEQEKLKAFTSKVMCRLKEPCPIDTGFLMPVKTETSRKKTSFIKRVQYGCMGYAPVVKRWHPDWLDYRPVLDLIQKNFFSSEQSDILYIRDCVNVFDTIFETDKTNVTTISLFDFLKNNKIVLAHKITVCFVHLLAINLSRIIEVVDFLPKNIKIVFFVNGITRSGCGINNALNIIFQYSKNLKNLHFVSNTIKNSLRYEIMTLSGHLSSSSFMRKLCLFFKISYKMFLIFIFCNLSREKTVAFDNEYSSVTFVITR